MKTCPFCQVSIYIGHAKDCPLAASKSAAHSSMLDEGPRIAVPPPYEFRHLLQDPETD